MNRLAAAWDKDPCICGHTRSAHRLRPRAAWPATLRRYGQCTRCSCLCLELDVDAMREAEAAERAERLAAFRALHP